MTDLASTSDLEARLGRSLTSTEQTRATAYLADASAAIRSWTKYAFAEVSGEVLRLRPTGMEARIPRRQITAVNSVKAIDWAGVPTMILPSGFWGWDGIDIITIAPYSDGVWLNLPDAEIVGYPDTYEVDVDHGDGDIPDVIVGICCAMVLAPLMSPSMIEGLNNQKVGEYSHGWQQGGSGSPGAVVRLTELDKQSLIDAGYGPRKATTIQVRF